MKGNVTIHIIPLLIIVALSATPALAQTPPAGKREAPAPLATIFTLTDGAVWVKRGSAGETRANLNDPLSSGDAIRTKDGVASLLQTAEPMAQYQVQRNTQVLIEREGDFPTRLERGKIVIREATSGGICSGTTVNVPGGTAKACGTEWSIEVVEPQSGSEPDKNGKATVTVVVSEGSVQLRSKNPDHPVVTVVPGDQVGQMLEGDPPRLRLIQPEDRVQFVEYYEASPKSYLAAGVAPGKTTDAIGILEPLMTTGGSAAQRLAFVDLLLAAGDYAGAREWARKGRDQYPRDAEFDAISGRVELLAGDANWYELGIKYADAATKKDPSFVDGWLVLGQLGYRGGEKEQARNGFTMATEVAKNDPRGYLGLSTVAIELEDFALARYHLEKAKPLVEAAGEAAARLPSSYLEYLSQRATLDGLENRLRSAQMGFDEVLAKAPTDYLARTGKALVSLKQGNQEAAELDLLEATLLQPRYARALQLMAVTHYRKEDFADAALGDLKRAMTSDDKDPVPYFLKAMIDTDYFRPNAAMDAAREAHLRLPYLKSLNQVANTQKGTANLGNTFAFVGLEDWAEHFAQESYFSSWAGSHFFLGDRYPGRFNKNSEYFQGLLTDPTVFGASTRFEALVQKPGTHLTVGTRMEGDNYKTRLLTTSPYLTLNGYNNASIPMAYFLNAATEEGRYLGRTDERLKQSVPYGTAAIGLRPTSNLNVFATMSANQLKGRYTIIEGPTVATVATRVRFDDTYRDHKAEIGLQYRFGPHSMLWARAGRSRSTLTGTFTNGEAGDFSDSVGDTVRGEEYQFRQTLQTSRHEFSWGLEAARRPRDVNFVTTGPGKNFSDTFNTRSEVAYIADRFAVTERWLLDALVAVTRSTDADTTPEYEDKIDQVVVAPRVGLVGRFGQERLIRLSYQDWVRPASDLTLAPVAIAGLPMDDRLVDYIGRLKATRAQVEWAWNAKTFVKGFVAREKVVDRDFVTPANAPKPPQNALRALERIRNRTLTNVATADLYEGSALYGATVDRAGLSLSQVIGLGISGTARYEHSVSRDDVATGLHAPYLPRHMTVLGATWVSPLRFYVSGQAVYRTARLGWRAFDFSDEEELPADWEANVIAYWELPNKRWSFEARATDLLPRGNKPVTFSADLKFRY